MSKKKLLSLSLVVIMIAILSFSTLAWFSDDDSVTNEFPIAGSKDQNPDEVFSVDVWEQTPDNEKEDVGYEYKDILPGDELTKNVFVENTGAYEQYVRVIVVVSDANEWKAVLGTTDVPELSAIVAGLEYADWTPNGKNYDSVNNNYWYVLYGTNKLGVGQKINVFDQVVIPEGMTQEQAAKFAGGFKIDIMAQAVQTENVGANCYDAFQTVKLDATAAYNSMIAVAP